MNPQMKAIREVHEFMTARQIPYMIIGGIALQCWGEPRFTRDIDYIRQWLREFSSLLGTEEALARFERFWRT